MLIKKIHERDNFKIIKPEHFLVHISANFPVQISVIFVLVYL